MSVPCGVVPADATSHVAFPSHLFAITLSSVCHSDRPSSIDNPQSASTHTAKPSSMSHGGYAVVDVDEDVSALP